jgi:hypothetical protein
MPGNDPQQIRRALDEIRKALDSYPREGLAEILAIVFKEYVVDSAQPMASGAQVLDARTDLEGMSFAELVVWLQTHLDVPELALFEVSGSDVSVRADGRTVRVRAQAAAPAPPPVAAQPAPQPAPAPPRAPASTSIPAQPTAAAPPVNPAAPPSTGAVQQQPEKTEEKSSAETGTRFSLLEVD